ncbi:hypothetical protein F4V88_17220 [Neorhizobium galegae]|nr:hypothetical protein F4V88_17220 [Neorhizobium galegae]
MTEAKKASGSRIGEWFKNRRTAKAICPAERRTLPIGAIAGQNITEPKEKPPNGGVLPLEFFHWRPTCRRIRILPLPGQISRHFCAAVSAMT